MEHEEKAEMLTHDHHICRLTCCISSSLDIFIRKKILSRAKNIPQEIHLGRGAAYINVFTLDGKLGKWHEGRKERSAKGKEKEEEEPVLPNA